MTPQHLMKRLGSMLALALLAGTVATAGAPAAAQAASDCRVKGSRTEEAGKHARVFSVRRVRDDAVIRRWYSCAYANGRRVHLGDVGLGGVHLDRISPVRLAGRYVATANEYTASTGDLLGAVVQVRDVRTGAFVHRFQSPSEPNTYDVTDLELLPDGTVAWIARVLGGTPATTTYEIRTSGDDIPSSRLIASGADIASRSLAVSARTLYWTQGDAPRSVKLP